MAAWSVLWHWATEPPLRSTPWQPHRGFSQERANICFWSIYFPQTRSSEHENQRFRTHILSLNPAFSLRARSSLSEVQREQLVELFEQGMGCRAAARVVGVSRDATRRLYRRFQLRGRLCLVEKPNKQHYSFEAKKEVVERHLAGESMMDLAREFNLSSDHLVKDWVAKWRRGGDEALRPKPKGRPKGSAAPKRLTEEEKLRRQVERLEAENAYLKKLRDLRNQGHA